MVFRPSPYKPTWKTAGISPNSPLPTCCHYEDAQVDRRAGETQTSLNPSLLILWMRKLKQEMVNILAEGHTAGQNQSQELKKWFWHVTSGHGIHTYLNHRLWKLEVIVKVTCPRLLFNAGSLQNLRQILIWPKLEYFQGQEAPSLVKWFFLSLNCSNYLKNFPSIEPESASMNALINLISVFQSKIRKFTSLSYDNSKR